MTVRRLYLPLLLLLLLLLLPHCVVDLAFQISGIHVGQIVKVNAAGFQSTEQIFQTDVNPRPLSRRTRHSATGFRYGRYVLL